MPYEIFYKQSKFSTKRQNQLEDLWQQLTRTEKDTQKTKLSLNFPKPEE